MASEVFSNSGNSSNKGNEKRCRCQDVSPPPLPPKWTFDVRFKRTNLYWGVGGVRAEQVIYL